MHGEVLKADFWSESSDLCEDKRSQQGESVMHKPVNRHQENFVLAVWATVLVAEIAFAVYLALT